MNEQAPSARQVPSSEQEAIQMIRELSPTEASTVGDSTDKKINEESYIDRDKVIPPFPKKLEALKNIQDPYKIIKETRSK